MKEEDYVVLREQVGIAVYHPHYKIIPIIKEGKPVDVHHIHWQGHNFKASTLEDALKQFRDFVEKR